MVLFAFDNSYSRLPEHFYARLAPTPVSKPRLVKLNTALADELGLDPAALKTDDGVAVLAGNRIPSGGHPIALAYAGHQFGSFVPQLGDGRALLLGEVIDREGRRRDIQLKGSGPTPFSRRGDGRAAIGPVLREYILSEAMHALGIPTTRSLAAVTTGDWVQRETALPGAVLTRIAASHIRVGTFQYFAARSDGDALQALADHVIARHYPELAAADNPYAALLDTVMECQARLVARWLSVGFIHGVMNTDNTSISGETIDYGPCAFMDTYDPQTVYSSIDHMGRYAYGNQPLIIQWNMARLAETLLPLLAEDKQQAVAIAQAGIDAFPARFEQAYLRLLRRKLGLLAEDAGDGALAKELHDTMKDGQADFTLTYRALTNHIRGGATRDDVRARFSEPSHARVDAWLERWTSRLASEVVDPDERIASMRTANPAFIPRNHLVEEALAAAQIDNDFGPFEALLDVLAHPYDEQPGKERYALPPEPHEVVRQTFCGT